MARQKAPIKFISIGIDIRPIPIAVVQERLRHIVERVVPDDVVNSPYRFNFKVFLSQDALFSPQLHVNNIMRALGAKTGTKVGWSSWEDRK